MEGGGVEGPRDRIWIHELVDEAKRLVEEARKKKLILRVVGGAGIAIHCRKFWHLGGRLIGDVDFIGHSKQRKKLKQLLLTLDYEQPRYYRVLAGGLGGAAMDRFILASARWVGFDIDVFFNKIVMCHTIKLKKRLEIDYPTISLADLLLQKLQVVDLTEKDLNDAAILLREHKVGKGDDETVNIDYIANLLANDWGFWYTITTNLNRLEEMLGHFPVLMVEDRAVIKRRIDQLLKRLEEEPKSLKWKLRARVGTRRPWYRQVEEVVR